MLNFGIKHVHYRGCCGNSYALKLKSWFHYTAFSFTFWLYPVTISSGQMSGICPEDDLISVIYIASIPGSLSSEFCFEYNAIETWPVHANLICVIYFDTKYYVESKILSLACYTDLTSNRKPSMKMKQTQTGLNPFLFWLECPGQFKGFWEKQVGHYCSRFRLCCLPLCHISLLLLLEILFVLLALIPILSSLPH